VVYLLVVFVAIRTLRAEALGGAGETAIAQAAEGFMPRFPVVGTGASLIAFGAVFSTISALNAVVIGSSRAFAMGREGQLPARLGRFHHRYGTPLVAIAASAVLMLDYQGNRLGGPDTVLEVGHRYVVAVESDVADGVTNLMRG
jgi:amino acid transporter